MGLAMRRIIQTGVKRRPTIYGRNEIVSNRKTILGEMQMILVACPDCRRTTNDRCPDANCYFAINRIIEREAERQRHSDIEVLLSPASNALKKAIDDYIFFRNETSLTNLRAAVLAFARVHW